MKYREAIEALKELVAKGEKIEEIKKLIETYEAESETK